MWSTWTRDTKREIEDPLKPELTSVPLCMILKDGRSVTLPGHNRVTRLGGGAEAVTLRVRNKEALTLHDNLDSLKEETPHLQITL